MCLPMQIFLLENVICTYAITKLMGRGVNNCKVRLRILKTGQPCLNSTRVTFDKVRNLQILLKSARKVIRLQAGWSAFRMPARERACFLSSTRIHTMEEHRRLTEASATIIWYIMCLKFFSVPRIVCVAKTNTIFSNFCKYFVKIKALLF